MLLEAMLDLGRVEEASMVTPKVHGESLTTEQKRTYLRGWALEVSGGDTSKLPTIREARQHIREYMGDSPGAGMGTDVITRTLRELREEIARPTAPVSAEVLAPSTPSELMDVIARIAQLMKAAGLESMIIDAEGFPVKFERFQK